METIQIICGILILALIVFGIWMTKTIINYDIKSAKKGWRSTSELPPVNKRIIGITEQGKAQEDVYYDGERFCCGELTFKIKWWSYPPEEL